MDLFLQLLFNGLFVGSIYLMLAMGFTILWGTTGIFDVGYGAYFVVAGFLMYLFYGVLSIPVYAAVPLVCVSVLLLGAIFYFLFYFPMQQKGASEFIIIAISVGILMLVENMIGFAFGSEAKFLTENLGSYQWLGVSIKGLDLLTVSVAAAVIVLMLWYLKANKIGTLMRAVADNKHIAQGIGIDTNRVKFFSYSIGVLLTVPPAVLVSFNQGVYPMMGMDYVLMAVIAVVIGGVGNITGAIVGALLLAVVQNLSVWQIPSQWQASISFLILVMFLLIKPSGLFGVKGRKGGV